MKINIDPKKGLEVVSGVMGKAANVGVKVASGVQAGAKDFADKTKQENYLRRMKKYNPLFPDKFFSSEFNIPNMVMIRDDAERRDIDVCEGAIGWIGTQNNIEILYLYDEAVEVSGLKFVPAPVCDAIYYVDNFDRRRFIRVDTVFNTAHKEKLAELQHIAFSLGAVRCSIEITETDSQSASSHKKASTQESATIHGVKVSTGSSYESGVAQSSSSLRSGRIDAEFSSGREPKHPELKWFKHDEAIKRLIEMCCSGENAVRTQTMILEGADSATMSQNTAKAVDGALGKLGGVKGQASMEMQATKENRSKLIFHIEF